MPQTIEELAAMMANRDSISYQEALAAIRDTAAELEFAFQHDDLNLAEDLLRMDLGLEPDYLDLFIY
jgi:hypothetical protein